MRAIRSLVGWIAALLLFCVFVLIAVFILGPGDWWEARRNKKRNHVISIKRFYHIRFAFYIWRHMPYCSFRQALKYPLPVCPSDNPEADAAAEVDYMRN